MYLLTYKTSQQKYPQLQPYANTRQSTYISPQPPYIPTPRQTAPPLNPILGAILQFVEQVNIINSLVDEIHDFIKMNIPVMTDNKKVKKVSFAN